MLDYRSKRLWINEKRRSKKRLKK